MAHTTSSTATTDAGGTGTTTTRTPHDTVNLSSKKDDILAEPLVAVPSAEGQKVSDEEFIKRIVNKAVQDIIQDEEYSHEATSLWTNKIVELLVRSFVNMDRDNKYIGTLHHPRVAELYQPTAKQLVLTSVLREATVIANSRILFSVSSRRPCSHLHDCSKLAAGHAFSDIMLLECPNRQRIFFNVS